MKSAEPLNTPFKISKQQFTPITTPWGVMELHTDKYVWYTHFPMTNRWVAYYGHASDKPWCSSNWRINDNILRTEEEAINACLLFVAKRQINEAEQNS